MFFREALQDEERMYSDSVGTELHLNTGRATKRAEVDHPSSAAMGRARRGGCIERDRLRAAGESNRGDKGNCSFRRSPHSRITSRRAQATSRRCFNGL